MKKKPEAIDCENYFLKNRSVQSQVISAIRHWNQSDLQTASHHHEDGLSLHRVQVRFHNPGTGCYANSTLNLLFSLPPFLRFLDQIPPQISNLADEMRRLARVPSSVTAECTDVRKIVGLPFSGDSQEDSHEFLTALLHKLESSLGDYSIASPPPFMCCRGPRVL